MLDEFFLQLRAGGVPATIREYLVLLEALDRGVADYRVENFYHLARATLVKDEGHYDRFDRVFAAYFRGVAQLPADLVASLPEEWLRRLAELNLSEADKAAIEALGGWEKLMETLRQRLAEQRERHQGGNKWIGTAGTSPFGAYGYNPEGVRIGQHESRHRRAVKVWDRREFRDLDGAEELGPRSLKLALRRLRRFAREGAAEELDLDGTIGATARNAGWLDLRLRPERHNAVKVLLFLDVGGSMDDHVRTCEALFAAARAEFKHLEHYYFHNFLYESVWRENRRRHTDRYPVPALMHRFAQDYKVIFVGDATMSPYEILHAGGALEYHNEEAGAVWLQRMLDTWPHSVWLNPQPEERWDVHTSIRLTRELMDERMYPLTLDGLDRAMRALAR